MSPCHCSYPPLAHGTCVLDDLSPAPFSVLCAFICFQCVFLLLWIPASRLRSLLERGRVTPTGGAPPFGRGPCQQWGEGDGLRPTPGFESCWVTWGRLVYLPLSSFSHL